MVNNTVAKNNKVSIHAPVKVRQRGFLAPLSWLVSIHAPVKVRPISNLSYEDDKGFQFTHP